MGYTGVNLGYNPSIDMQIKEIESELKGNVIYFSKRGSVFYIALQLENGDVTACVSLTRRNKGEFMYKTMCETECPCYYNAPLKLLKMLSPTENKYALEWRAKCKEKKN